VPSLIEEQARRGLSRRLAPNDFRLLREARGLTLTEVGEGVGMDGSALSKVERGLFRLTPQLEIRLLRYFFGPTSTP
jgi:transcriptional regulator with XRE-family HTH domain